MRLWPALLLALAACAEPTADLEGPRPGETPTCPPRAPPPGLVTWTSGLQDWSDEAGARARASGPTCLGRVLSVSVSGGTPPYWWEIASAATPGFTLTEADRPTARLWFGPGSTAQVALRVEDAAGESAFVGVVTDGPRRAWVPWHRGEAGVDLLDVCSGDVVDLPDMGERRVRGGWLVFVAGRPREAQRVYRVDLRAEAPTPTRVELPASEGVDDLRVLSDDGAVSFTIRDGDAERLVLAGPPGQSPWVVSRDAPWFGRAHRVVDGRSRFLVHAAGEGWAMVDGPDRPLHAFPDARDVRWTDDHRLLVERDGSLELADLDGRVLARVDLDGEAAFPRTPTGWVADVGGSDGLGLLRLREGCVDRAPLGPARWPRWFASGRAGTATTGGGALAWVIRDDGSVAVSPLDVPGRPHRGAIDPVAHRLAVGGDAVTRVVTLDAAAAASDAFALPLERFDLSPDGTFAFGRQEGAWSLYVAEPASTPLATTPLPDRVWIHPSGLAAAATYGAETDVISYDPIHRAADRSTIPGELLEIRGFLY